MREIKLREYFGKRKVRGEVGAEIEVEGTDLPNTHNLPERAFTELDKWWKLTYDGSLRGESIEYVLKLPLSRERLGQALDTLDNCFVESNGTINDSIRAGVHIHINVQELTGKQLAKFMTLYYTLENLITTFCGEGRQGNLFCLRASDAEYSIYSACNAFRARDFHAYFTNTDIRYSAMNLCSLPKFGSLEFRALRTPQDLYRINTWALILLRIKEESLKFDSPEDIVLAVSDMGEGFAKHILGEYMEHFKEVDADVLVKSGMRNAQELAYCTDWNKFTLGASVEDTD